MKVIGKDIRITQHKPMLDVRGRDLAKFTPFLHPAILKIWREFDKATLPHDEFEKLYPVKP